MSKRCLWMCAAGLPLVLLFSACQARQPEPQPQPQPQPQYELTATIKDIMDSMVDPIADVLWESVATIVTHGRTEERVPKTDEDWLKVRRGAITLIEATDAPGLGDAGEQIDSACESCHLKYWYPNQVIPEFPKNLPASN